MPDLTHDEIKQDLLTNPRYAAFFAAYHPVAVAGFAVYYALEKCEWQYRGAQAEVDQAYALSTHSDAAYNRLWEIQRKKLFDLQCQWRAGQVTLPGVDCTADFRWHDAGIENCAVPEPISPDELAMYCDFVRQATHFDQDVLDCHGGDGCLPRDWQDYRGMRLFEQEFDPDTPDHERLGTAGPAWYDFHNGRTGNGFLLGLPDRRGALEARYHNAFGEHLRAEHAARPAAPPPADARCTALPLAEIKALQQAFLKQFESPQLRREQEAYLEYRACEAADQQVKADFAYLKAFGPTETVPIEAAADWRAALRRAAVETQREQLLAHLPQVYEEYLMRQSLGITHPQADEPRWRNTDRFRRESILNGRELLGEPRNFDF